MVYQLAQVNYNDMLQDAAAARAGRQATVRAVAPAARKRSLLLAAAAAAPLTLWLLWVLVSH
jgi:hypothetical protein